MSQLTESGEVQNRTASIQQLYLSMNLYLQNIGVCQDFRGAGLYAQDEIDAVSRIYGNGVLAGREKACQKLISGKLACDVLGCSVCKIECDGVIKNGIDVSETVVLHYGNAKCTLKMSLAALKEQCTIVGTRGKIVLPLFHVAGKATLTNDNGKRVFRGKTDYLTEFNRVADEIRQGKKESSYIPFSSTRACMEIMDECRRQMNLVYPFEK